LAFERWGTALYFFSITFSIEKKNNVLFVRWQKPKTTVRLGALAGWVQILSQFRGSSGGKNPSHFINSCCFNLSPFPVQYRPALGFGVL
jgi:hypothetical protein